MPKTHASSDPVIDVTPIETPVTPKVAHETGSLKADPIVELTPEAIRAVGDKIVMRGTYTSLGVGFIPIPVVDILAISGFQMKMIAELSELHGVKFSEHTARNVITALVGSLGAVIVGQYATRTLLKFIPGVGTAIAGLWVQGLIDGAVTYGIGRVFQQHFERGGTIFDLDVKKAKDLFAVKFHEGRAVVAKSVSNATSAAASTFRSRDGETVVVSPA